MSEHWTEKAGDLIATTPLADTLSPNMLLGMRRSEGWVIVRALRASDQPLTDRLAESLATQLRDHGDRRHALRVV